MNVEIKGVESNAVALGLIVTIVIIKIMDWLSVLEDPRNPAG